MMGELLYKENLSPERGDTLFITLIVLVLVGLLIPGIPSPIRAGILVVLVFLVFLVPIETACYYTEGIILKKGIIGFIRREIPIYEIKHVSIVKMSEIPVSTIKFGLYRGRESASLRVPLPAEEALLVETHGVVNFLIGIRNTQALISKIKDHYPMENSSV
jgi:hypothetical protein